VNESRLSPGEGSRFSIPSFPAETIKARRRTREKMVYLHRECLRVTLLDAQLLQAGDLNGAKALGLGDEAAEEDVV